MSFFIKIQIKIDYSLKNKDVEKNISGPHQRLVGSEQTDTSRVIISLKER